MTKEQVAVILLVKKAMHPQMDVSIPLDLDWARVIDFASDQGVLGVSLDALDFIRQAQGSKYVPDMDNLMEWLGQVEYQTTLYEEYRISIDSLASFYGKQEIKMLLMKGYGLSLNYPIPNHRPIGDIDIFLFGHKEFADQMVEQKIGITVDREYHKHSHFTFNGITVENHETFIDDLNHKSNRKFQKILEKQLQKDKLILSPIDNCYFPSATWNALFLIRHAGEHFAAEKITLRHVLDLGCFFESSFRRSQEVSKVSEGIDWSRVLKVYQNENMKMFYDAIATICKNYLGFQNVSESFRGYQERPALAERIVEDIFAPSEKLPMSTKGIYGFAKLKYSIKKSIRWWQNRWKYRIIYNEPLWQSFSMLALNRLRHLYRINLQKNY